MKTLRDYINLVSEKSLVSEKVTLPADPNQPVQTQTVNGVTMNAPANAVQTGSGGTLKTSDGRAVTSGTPAPDANAAAAAKAKLTPSQLKWLGGADATDPAIMARMPKPQPGEQVPGAAPAQSGTPAAGAAAGGAAQAAQPAAPSGPPPGSVDDEGNLMPGFTTDENGNVVSAGDPNFVEPATQALAKQGQQAAKEKAYADAADAADQELGQAMAANAQAATTQAANGVNAQGQNVTIANADGSKTNPETGETTPAAAPAQAAAPAAPAQSGQPANRDSMTFGQAFADAKAKGEKQFTWKGKPYAVQMAQTKPAQGAGAGRGNQGGPTAAQAAQANATKPPPVQAGKPAQPPGMGKPGPTVAAAQGADPKNPLNQKKESREPRDSKFVAELDAMRRIAGLR